METIKVLKVKHYGETPEENRMITLSPMNVMAVVAPEGEEIVQDRSVKRITALMSDGGSLELVVSDLDLNTLEEAVGGFMAAY